MEATYDCQKNPDEIASRMKISRRTVYNMIQAGFKYEEKEAREPILDEDDRTATIIEAANEDRDLTAAEIARDEQPNAKGVSASTIERLLNDNLIKSRLKRVIKDITVENKEIRL